MIFHFVPFPVLIVFSVCTLFAVKTTAYDEAFEDSAHHPATKMLRSLKGTKDFLAPVNDQQTSQEMEAFLSNNKQEERRLDESNLLSTQKFPTKSELQSAVNVYCNDPNGWINTSEYATYGPIKDWDVSLITDMSSLFSDKYTCNPDIASWDVSNGTNFTQMFFNAKAFNQDIDSWNVSNGEDFSYMFQYTDVFNQDIGSWDVSNGVYFHGMFYRAKKFNQDIGSWNVSNGEDFYRMFQNANQFNQDIGSWDVSNGEDFSYMFIYANAFNQDIGSWDVSNGKEFYGMFYNAKSFNQDIGSWDVSNGKDFNRMFYMAYAFNKDIGSWDVSNGVYFGNMFQYAYAFNHDVGSWDVSNGDDFSYMFNNATSFNHDIGSWDVSNGEDFDYMFYGATSFNQNLCRWEKSPTATKSEFCTGGSYCGECSLLCNVVDVFAQTLFLPYADACWRVQLAFGGTLEADFTDVSCSKTESEWQSTNGVYSIFATISVLDETAVFIPGTNGFSGTFQFVEDPTVTQASLQMLSWDPTAKVFAIEVTIPTCSADAFCPTMKIEL